MIFFSLFVDKFIKSRYRGQVNGFGARIRLSEKREITQNYIMHNAHAKLDSFTD